MMGIDNDEERGEGLVVVLFQYLGELRIEAKVHFLTYVCDLLYFEHDTSIQH
jgi:hypothetical protein